MTRVSTMGNYQSALLDLMKAQGRQQLAQERLDSEKIATDSKGYGRTSQNITALKATQSRLAGFVASGEAVEARLASQDIALTRVGEGGTGAREAIATAIAAGRLEGLMAELQGHFQTMQSGLNFSHQGQYLLGGGLGDAPPATADSLAALAAAPDVASVFANDRQAQKSRIGESATLTTGFLADDVGAALTEVFRNIQIYQNGDPVTVDGVTYTPSVVPPRTTAAGNIDGSASDEVTAFLTKQMQMLDKANAAVTVATARNGSMQNQVEDALAAHQAQQTSLTKMLDTKTGYDPAQAITDLQLAEVAIQASAQVIVSLRSTSLLDLLR
jgi:flagellar hook-associated protein 3 FlgL